MEAHKVYLWSKSYIVNSSHRLQFLRAAVVCAIFERISVLSRHLRQTISLMCLKFFTIPGFCLVTLPCNLICITKDRPIIWVLWPLGCVVRFLCTECSLNLHCHHNSRNCIALSNILFIRVELVFCYTFLRLVWILIDLPHFAEARAFISYYGLLFLYFCSASVSSYWLPNTLPLLL